MRRSGTCCCAAHSGCGPGLALAGARVPGDHARRDGGRLLAPLRAPWRRVARFLRAAWRDARWRSLARRRTDMRPVVWADHDATRRELCRARQLDHAWLLGGGVIQVLAAHWTGSDARARSSGWCTPFSLRVEAAVLAEARGGPKRSARRRYPCCSSCCSWAAAWSRPSVAPRTRRCVSSGLGWGLGARIGCWAVGGGHVVGRLAVGVRAA